MKAIFTIAGLIIAHWIFVQIAGFELTVICLLCNMFYWIVRIFNDQNKQS